MMISSLSGCVVGLLGSCPNSADHCRSIEPKAFGCLHGGVADVRCLEVAADDVRLALAAS